MKTQNAKRLRKALWLKACRFDNIPPDSMFIVFSDDNPYLKRYNRIGCLIMAGSSV
ncbi:hypothetical protein KAR91_12225 [Candidatus Pacearchaeota archaeon]|nr:hypothetical protein [Candidatus Pacearchaeota archaeon]